MPTWRQFIEGAAVTTLAARTLPYVAASWLEYEKWTSAAGNSLSRISVTPEFAKVGSLRVPDLYRLMTSSEFQNTQACLDFAFNGLLFAIALPIAINGVRNVVQNFWRVHLEAPQEVTEE